jgi:hypothetical protein
MASNGGFFPAERLVWYAEAKLLCDAIFVRLLPKLELNQASTASNPSK